VVVEPLPPDEGGVGDAGFIVDVLRMSQAVARPAVI